MHSTVCGMFTVPYNMPQNFVVKLSTKTNLHWI